MKRCPIAAKIAGSIGILPCCVLNEFFTYRFVRPLLPAILCIWEIWSLRIHVSRISPCLPKKKDYQNKKISASPHRFLIRLMTRNWRLSVLVQFVEQNVKNGPNPLFLEYYFILFLNFFLWVVANHKASR